MSTVTQVPYDNSVTSVVGSSGGDVMGEAMAVLLAQYTSLQDDLKAQIDAVDQRNATKRLWNEKLSGLNNLLQDPAFVGKKTSDSVELYVKPEDLPYKDYSVAKDANGNVSLQPAPQDESNMVSKDGLTKIYGPPGSDPKTAEDNYNNLVVSRDAAARRRDSLGANVPIEQRKAAAAEVAAYDAQIKAAQQNVCGYKVKISAEQINKQLDNVRAAVDSLNTDGQIDMLRLSDLFGKANTKVEQLSKILSSNNDAAEKIISAIR